jgi:hypothetical protein
MRAGLTDTEKEAVRYHLRVETVKKSSRATDEVFRFFSGIASAQPHATISKKRCERECPDPKEGA